MQKIKIKHLLLINFLVLLLTPFVMFFFANYGVDSMLKNIYGYKESIESRTVPHRFSKSPIITDEVIRDFIKKAIVNTLSFEANKLAEQESTARPFFSDSGWASFWGEYKITQNNLINNEDMIRMTAVVNQSPLILGFRSFGEKKYWRFYLDGNYQAVGKGGEENRPFTAILELSQTASHENIKGIAIDRMDIR